MQLMFRTLRLLILLIVTLYILFNATDSFAHNRPPIALTPAEIYARVSPAVVEVSGHCDGYIIKGSGFLIRGNTVVTAAHVVAEEDFDPYTVTLKDGRQFRVLHKYLDSEHDVAVLTLTASVKVKTLKITPTAMQIGEPVYAIGYPQMHDSQFFTGGYVDGYDEGLMSISAGTTSGDSGGPVLDRYGNVCGITESMEPDAEFLRFVTPAETLRKSLSNLLNDVK